MRLLNRSAGRISRHRRGPLAGVVALLLGLVMMGGLYAAFSPASADSQDSQAAMAAKGRQLFLVGCAYCHGQNGQGLSTINGQNIGPTLVGVGAAATDFQVGTGRMPLAQPGSQAPRKEIAYNDEETAELAAFVASLAPGPAIPDAASYSIDGLTAEQQQDAIARGGQIFLTNCTACHNFEGSGGAMPRGEYAPKIRNEPAKYIYEAMLTGPQAMPNFSNGNITPDEKRDVIAYIATLRDAPDTGGFGLGGLGPVSEGLFAWLVGIGGLVGFAVWIAAHTARTKKQKPAGPSRTARAHGIGTPNSQQGVAGAHD